MPQCPYNISATVKVHHKRRKNLSLVEKLETEGMLLSFEFVLWKYCVIVTDDKCHRRLNESEWETQAFINNIIVRGGAFCAVDTIDSRVFYLLKTIQGEHEGKRRWESWHCCWLIYTHFEWTRWASAIVTVESSCRSLSIFFWYEREYACFRHTRVRPQERSKERKKCFHPFHSVR